MKDSYPGTSAIVDELAKDVEWNIRPYREGDISAIVDLINAVDSAYKLGEGTSAQELAVRFESPRSVPTRQVVIAGGTGVPGLPDGMAAGYGRVTYEDDHPANERMYYANVTVHPAAEGMGLEHVIATKLFEIIRGYETDTEIPPMKKAVLNAWTREEVIPIRLFWESMGLKEARRFWVMARNLHDPIDEPQLIEGINIRNYVRPDDNRRAMIAFDNSFSDHWDHHPPEEEEWDYWMNLAETRPDLSWLAEVESEPGTIGGFCICGINEDENKRKGVSEGWIHILGTTREWRRVGLGRALVLHGLHSLREAGLDTALLGVDSESPTGANRLYESVGFRVRSREIAFKRPLEEVEAYRQLTG